VVYAESRRLEFHRCCIAEVYTPDTWMEI